MTDPRLPFHRKQVKHFDEPGHVHELTFSCFQRRPLLTNDDDRKGLCTAIDRAMVRHGYQLFAFVVMPEHVHLVVHPGRNASLIAELLRAIKRPFSWRVKKRLEVEDRHQYERLHIRQRPGVSTFRFWQEGPGYDRNLTSASAIEAAIYYVHLNPVRRKLCDRAIDWKWSSARFYLSPDAAFDRDLPAIARLPPDILQ